MRHVVTAVGAALVCSATLFAAKPPPTSTSNPQVAYISGSGNSIKLMVANENGANAHVLYSSNLPFRFDLAPRAQRKVSINGRDGTLRLLSYTQSSNGTLSASGAPVALTQATSGTNHDFSPDGRRIAYSCCDGGAQQKLMVFDLDTSTATEWATVEFVWDVAFFRGGSSIAYVVPAANNMYEVYEISSPGQTPRKIFSTLGDIYFDSARMNPDALVLTYRPNPSTVLLGLWRAPSASETEGTFLVPNLTNRSVAFYPTLNCDDTKLAYMSSTTPAGGQVFFIRNLNTNQDALFSKTSNIQLQFWPTC